MRGFFDGKLEYCSYVGEDDDYNAVYKKYTVDGAAIREIFAVDEESVEGCGVTVYFFPNRSRCTDSEGSRAAFPRPKAGDLCILRSGEDDERIMRVAEIGYFTAAGDSSHIRMKLR